MQNSEWFGDVQFQDQVMCDMAEHYALQLEEQHFQIIFFDLVQRVRDALIEGFRLDEVLTEIEEVYNLTSEQTNEIREFLLQGGRRCS